MSEKLKKGNNLKVGITVFIGIVILLVLTVIVGLNEFAFAKTFRLFIRLDNTAGLVNGAPVTLGGYKIGNIEEVRFIADGNGPDITVTLRIRSEYKSQIRGDSRAKITSIGILGEKFVDINIGSSDLPEIKENTFLEVESTFSLDNLAMGINPGIENFNATMKNIRSITDSIAGGRGSVSRLINTPSTLENLNRVLNRIDITLSKLDSKNGTVGKLINDSELYDNLTTAAGDLKNISSELNSGKGSLGKLLQSDSLYNNINSAAVKINSLLLSAQSDSTVVGGLINDKKLYAKLNGLIDELNALVTDIKEHPEKYVNVSVF